MSAHRNVLDVGDFNHLAYRDNPHYEALRSAMDDFARSDGLDGAKLRTAFREIDNSRYFGHVELDVAVALPASDRGLVSAQDRGMPVAVLLRPHRDDG